MAELLAGDHFFLHILESAQTFALQVTFSAIFSKLRAWNFGFRQIYIDLRSYENKLVSDPSKCVPPWHSRPDIDNLMVL